MSLRVFIDTTFSGVVMGFVDESQTHKIAWFGMHTKKGNADSAICSLLEQGLQELKRRHTDINCFVVSHGPGSFTGIKVGLAWAYGYQAARNQNMLVAVSSLEAGCEELARKHKQSKIAVLVPISRRESFLCWQEEKVEFQILDHGSKDSEDRIEQLASHSYLIFFIKMEKMPQEIFSKQSSFLRAISVEDFMKLALEGMVSKTASWDLEIKKSRILPPHYMKKTTVEEKLGNTNGTKKNDN